MIGVWFFQVAKNVGFVHNDVMPAKATNIQELLEIAIKQGASDLHLTVGMRPLLRVDGELHQMINFEVLTGEVLMAQLESLMSNEQAELYRSNRDLDFSFEFEKLARFRVNAYFQLGQPAAALRLVTMKIPTIDELNLPAVCHWFAQLKQGLVLVTGPTGHGKSTTQAAIINEVNQMRSDHIVTIEDPIEYVHTPDKCLISQRELHSDTLSWSVALKSVLREDPNVVLVGEMRDFETIESALTIAETGHLVLATLHTNSAAQTIDRIVGVFPPHQQNQIRMQLAAVLSGVFSQRLLPAQGGGRVVAYEILLNNPAVMTSIREGKTHMIDNIIMTSSDVGMSLLENSLARLVNQNVVSQDVAAGFSIRPEELYRQIHGKKK